MYDEYLGPNGVFGRKGPKYEHRLVLRELIEVPGQTYQAYWMTRYNPSVGTNLLFVSIIVLDCLLVPSFMMKRNMQTLKHRNDVLLMDVMFELMLGALIPLFLLASKLIELWTVPHITNDMLWNSRGFSIVAYILVTSPIDLVLTMAPVFFAHLMLDTIHKNWSEIGHRQVSKKASTYPF